MGYYKSANRFYASPQVGDQIFFTDSKGGICHTGLVYALDGNTVYTIEGNTSPSSGVVANGGCVAKKSYSRNYGRIAGYGRPNYSLIKEDKIMLETGNDIVWELMNGSNKIEILDPQRAIQALDSAKHNEDYLSLYWIIYKLVNKTW